MSEKWKALLGRLLLTAAAFLLVWKLLDWERAIWVLMFAVLDFLLYRRKS